MKTLLVIICILAAVIFLSWRASKENLVDQPKYGWQVYRGNQPQLAAKSLCRKI